MIDFLILLVIIWLVSASISDLNKREVPNWLSFSLIIFALAYKLFYSIINSNFNYILYSLLGLLVFIVLAYAFYYGKIFAGGDAKLLMPLGAILPSASLNSSIFYCFLFILLMFSAGGVWGLLYSGGIAIKNKKKFKRNFFNEFKKRKIMLIASLLLALIVLTLGFYDEILFILPIIILIFPFLFVYAKSMENLMIISISSKKATVGDWLAEQVKVQGKIIKPYWEGLSEEQVKLLAKSNIMIKVKQGIPFIPGFLIAFLFWIVLKDYYWFFSF
ncbi:MAG: A24 family peptidase [Candidatus Pacearchaeota archaeon]|nr:A24 family peptidase [Candidatus Pacearchaeota archaeon]